MAENGEVIKRIQSMLELGSLEVKREGQVREGGGGSCIFNYLSHVDYFRESRVKRV